MADGNTEGVLGKQLSEAPGGIIDAVGNKLGEHKGTHGSTVAPGQAVVRSDGTWVIGPAIIDSVERAPRSL